MTAVKHVSDHGYRPTDSPPTLYTVVGCAAGKGSGVVFLDAETAVAQPPPRRVSFAEDANTLCTEDDSPVLSQISPPLTQPVVEVADEDAPASEGDGLQTCSPDAAEMPPPPGFPPFVFPDDDGGIDVDEICARLGECATEACQEMEPGLPDIPEESEPPKVVVPRPPSPNIISEAMPAVGYACVPLPLANNGAIPELVRMPAFPQTTGRTIDRERMVPRWWLAREGPFLEERSAESIRLLGPGCAFRNTTYRASDYAEPAGEYGLLLNPPDY